MAEKSVRIPLSQLSDHQLLLYNTRLLEKVAKQMTELGVAVQDLQTAVDGVAQRLLPEIASLEAALASAQADDATAAQVAADASAAVANIRTEVDRLNALGTDPSTPVDTSTPPADPPPVEVPADPEAPAGDTPVDPTPADGGEIPAE
jgi:predicted alpha-1,6-mannanase (GH76 family)